nr:serine hydrolase domain-containing protein [uncultured Desulfobulbus sp.]
MLRQIVSFLGIALVFCVLLPFTPAAVAKMEGDASLGLRLDQVLTQAVTSQRIVGAVVIVLQDGKTMYHKGFGYADREGGIVMQTDHIFRFASLSKPIVTVALLRLAEAGKLNLNDPVTKFIPDFKPRLSDGTSPNITLHQLLTHTAGLSSDFSLQSVNTTTESLSNQVSEAEEELNRIRAAGLAYFPGKGWGYSLAIDVLGVVLERATGMSLEEVVREWGTKPAGMEDTGFFPKDLSRLTVPYADGTPPVRMKDPHLVPFGENNGIVFSPGRILNRTMSPIAGSGMSGTAADMAHLLEVIRTGGGNLLPPSVAQSLMTNHTGRFYVLAGPGWGFGYGGAVLLDPERAKTPQSVGTWSWGGVWGHSWFVDPQLKLVVVALTNTALEGVSGRFPLEIRDAVYGRSQTQEHSVKQEL